MSKMLKITMIIVITFFSILLTPHERASANPLAVGGALYLGGAGVYVAGAIGVAAIAGLAGCDSCADDIEAHAGRTWDGSTQIVKDGLQLMVDASVGAWGATSSALTSVDANVNTWMDSQIDQIAQHFTDVSIGALSEETRNGMILTKSSCNGGNCLGFVSGNGDYFTPQWIVNGAHYSGAQLVMNPYDQKITFTNRDSVSPWAFHEVSISLKGKYTEAEMSYFRTRMSQATNLVQAYAVYELLGYSVTSATAATYQKFVNAKTSATEAWEEMTDAGLVLPTDTARPMAGNIPLTYDPVTDAYSGIDGVNVPREDITGYDYGKPHWKTLEDLAMLGLSGLGAGLYIDGWASADSITSVYDPVTDTTATTSTTTGSTTNVTTGETVTTDAVTTTTTTTGDTTGNPSKTPEGTTPKTPTGKSNRWGKLVTTKFPFSLPWDLFFILSFLNAEPKTPVFSIDERINKRENVEGIQIKFDIDLSFLDPYVPWFRRFIVLGFALFLILNTRKLLGGAQ